MSDEEKRSICRQACAPRASVAEVTQRYAVNSNPIFTWLRDPRFVPAGAGASSGAGDCNLFLPVEIIGSATEPEPGSDFNAHGSEGDPVLVQRVDITLSDLRRVVVE